MEKQYTSVEVSHEGENYKLAVGYQQEDDGEVHIFEVDEILLLTEGIEVVVDHIINPLIVDALKDEAALKIENEY